MNNIESALKSLEIDRLPSSSQELKGLYRKMALKYHPDRTRDFIKKTYYHKKFIEVSVAYKYLQNRITNDEPIKETIEPYFDRFKQEDVDSEKKGFWVHMNDIFRFASDNIFSKIIFTILTPLGLGMFMFVAGGYLVGAFGLVYLPLLPIMLLLTILSMFSEQFEPIADWFSLSDKGIFDTFKNKLLNKIFNSAGAFGATAGAVYFLIEVVRFSFEVLDILDVNASAALMVLVAIVATIMFSVAIVSVFTYSWRKSQFNKYVRENNLICE